MSLTYLLGICDNRSIVNGLHQSSPFVKATSVVNVKLFFHGVILL